MIKIKNLTVKVNYNVGLGDVEMPSEVYTQIKKAFDEGMELDGMGEKYPEATEWLKDNIQERDCMDLEYEISNIS